MNNNNYSKGRELCSGIIKSSKRDIKFYISRSCVAARCAYYYDPTATHDIVCRTWCELPEPSCSFKMTNMPHFMKLVISYASVNRLNLVGRPMMSSVQNSLLVWSRAPSVSLASQGCRLAGPPAAASPR